jgi:hypothetical protein
MARASLSVGFSSPSWEAIMEENRELEPKQSEEPVATGTRGSRWPVTVTVALLLAVLFSFIYAFRQRDRAQQLAADQVQMASALDQTRSQLDALAQKVSSLSTTRPAAPAAPVTAETKPSATATAHGRARRARVVEDARWKKMQQQLEDQQQQLQQTQQDLDTARNEMSDNLNSTRDDLNGSIARTHDELVALEKKGERDYHEFDLTKSKRFEHVGPILLSLRKANTKHKYYDLMMLVNDDTLAKKHVDLYEPIWIYPADSPQPIQLVVNHISKNAVHGYVSEPKYNGTGTQAANASSAASATPASQAPSGSTTGTATTNPESTDSGTPNLERRPEPNPQLRF